MEYGGRWHTTFERNIPNHQSKIIRLPDHCTQRIQWIQIENSHFWDKTFWCLSLMANNFLIRPHVMYNCKLYIYTYLYDRNRVSWVFTHTMATFTHSPFFCSHILWPYNLYAHSISNVLLLLQFANKNMNTYQQQCGTINRRQLGNQTCDVAKFLQIYTVHIQIYPNIWNILCKYSLLYATRYSISMPIFRRFFFFLFQFSILFYGMTKISSISFFSHFFFRVYVCVVFIWLVGFASTNNNESTNKTIRKPMKKRSSVLFALFSHENTKSTMVVAISDGHQHYHGNWWTRYLYWNWINFFTLFFSLVVYSFNSTHNT